MDFFNVVNAALVAGIIVLIETFKKLLKEIWKLEPPVWVWKVAVLIMGIPAALIARAYDNWRQFVTAAIIYAAAATIFYQTGKMVAGPFLEKKE